MSKVAKSEFGIQQAVEQLQSQSAPNGVDISHDPFSPENLNALRLGQDFGQVVGIRKVITTVPVRKPNRQEFIRVHADQAYRIESCFLELKDDRAVFMIAPVLWSDLTGEITPRVLFTCINRQGDVFLWPVKRPGADGRIDNWSTSALSASQTAMTQWTRVAANMTAGLYDTFTGSDELAAPVWPSIDFSNLLRIAFRDRYIDSWGHSALRRLRGEI